MPVETVDKFEELANRFNLGHSLMHDPKLRSRMGDLLTRLADLEEVKQISGEKYLEARNDVIMSIWKDCNFNFSLLTGYFFPDYPKGSPMSMLDRPFNMALMFCQPYWNFTLRGSRQIGKSQPYSEPVATPRGWRQMGELEVGDQVFGRDGQPCTILEIHEQGERDVYRVTFTDGAETRCDLDHNWMIRRAGCKNWKVETLREILDRAGPTPSSDRAVRIPMTEPVDYPGVELPLSPYCIGALLGDGGLTQRGIRFSTKDPEVLNRIAGENDLIYKPVKGSLCDYYLQGVKEGTTSSLQNALRGLGMMGCNSLDKVIPPLCKLGTVEQRLDLLQGLMDTDGTIYGKSQIEFYSSSKRLAEDVAELVESLGGVARLKTKQAYYKDATGTRVEGAPSWRVKITNMELNPFWLPRKALRFYSTRYRRDRKLARIDKDGVEDCRCLVVDSPDHTYLTRHHIVTHNTTTLGVRGRIASELIARLSSLYVAPHTEPLKTFARKFDEMNQAFRFEVQDQHRFKQNMYYRKYPNKSVYELVRVQTSATPARGKTADEIVFDECQLFDPSLETEVLEVLNDSDIKSILYTGTSTTFDTLLEERYQDGCQATWHVMRDNGQTIDCGDPEQVIPCIGQYCMLDPDTGKKLDPMRGFYRFNNPAAFEDRCFSTHIPQVINPDIAYKPAQWEILWRTLQRDKEKFIQEKLGIPVESADRELTMDDLKRLCQPEVVGDYDERKRRARSGYYKCIVSGIDWGGSDYNALTRSKISNTTHVIFALAPDNNIHVLHQRRHGGKQYKDIINLIAKDHEMFCAGGVASDFGVGEVYHELMRSHPSFNKGRHIIWHYTGPRSAICSVMKGKLSNTLNLNKTESLTALILGMVMAEPTILCGSWEENEEFLEDFLHIHRVLQEKEGEGGQRYFTYQRQASKTDDIVQAWNFAFSLLRLVYNQILLEDAAARQMLRSAVLGSDRAPQGSYTAPSTMNQLMRQANEVWDSQGLEDYYQTDDYQDYE